MISPGCREGRPLLSIEQARDFLLDTKLALAQEGALAFEGRSKNLQCLAELGILATDVVDLLRCLRTDDYCEGPLDDDKGRPIRWWVFGPSVLECCIYVKIALHGKKVICRSFHKPQWPMTYPLRRNGVSVHEDVLH